MHLADVLKVVARYLVLCQPKDKAIVKVNKTLLSTIVVPICVIRAQIDVRPILHYVRSVSILVVLFWIEDLSHELLPDCLAVCQLIGFVLSNTLNLTIGIRVGNNAVLFVNLLCILATIDNHDKVESLLVIHGVVPEVNLGDVRTYPLIRCFAELIGEEFFPHKAWLLFLRNLICKQVHAFYSRVPSHLDCFLCFCLLLREKLNAESLIDEQAIAW